ncbi:uncharacterized protein Fot_14677 [Forsythia ovata]|uniref:Transposase n=1 Tax=Forsythia ovata TaxID=205694 RepID=A0ABD1W6Z8_9LAMI
MRIHLSCFDFYYDSKRLGELRKIHRRKTIREVEVLRNKEFPTWFRNHMSSSEHFDSDNEKHSDTDIHGNGGSQNIGQTRRKGRGHDKPKWGKSGKEKIEFTKDGLCIVPKDAKLSRYLGSLARTYNFLPFSHTDWRLYKDPIVEKIWKTISDTIDWRPEDIPHIHKIRHTLLKRLAKRVRNNRAELKRKYYTPNVGSPLRFMCGDDRVDSEQWREIVNYWDSDSKNKNKVEKNVENRKQLKMSHTGGTKSFVRHLAGFEQKHGHTPDPIEAFNLVHKRKDKHKSWIDDASEQMGAKISQELTGLVATHGEETPKLRLQAYVTARGFETGGRVRGYGDVVTPDMVPWIT